MYMCNGMDRSLCRVTKGCPRRQHPGREAPALVAPNKSNIEKDCSSQLVFSGQKFHF